MTIDAHAVRRRTSARCRRCCSGRRAQFGDAAAAVSIAGASWSHARRRRAWPRARAAALQRAGVARGDRVALMCGNRVELLETFLGCGWLGAVAVPINTASMGPQIEYLLRDSGARLLVIEDRFVERLERDLARRGCGDLGRRRRRAGRDAPTASRARGPPARAVAPAPMRPCDTLAILYTSGTTGPAEGRGVPARAVLLVGRAQRARCCGVGADDVLCTTLPLFHINALNTFAQAAVAGCRVALRADASRPRRSGRRCARAAPPWSTCSARWCRSCWRSRPARDERDHRVRIGLGPGVPAAAGDAFRERTGVRAARRLRLDRDQLRHRAPRPTRRAAA